MRGQMGLLEFLDRYREEDWVSDILVKPTGPKDIDILILTNASGMELFHRKNMESQLYINSSMLNIDIIAYSKGKLNVLTKDKETYFIVMMTKEDYELIAGGSKDGE